jgi:hypothetical protein
VRKHAPAPAHNPAGVCTLRDYTDDEALFLRAVLRFRSLHHRPPTLIEAFRLALALGWRKET